MQIGPGTSLLHYTIAEKIGEGGMGVVWRATDTTLDRDVAIKVLPEILAGDPGRLTRFEREAKLLASLNHPNIAAVYGLHEQQGVRFIAMELVAGEDLAEVIARGPLPAERVMEIAQQVADALEAAHEQGVIHRDLKPANIRITPEDKVKVLDFGLAKAFEPDPTSANVSPTMSPTITSAGTVAGMILGTAAYMSPEQARGQTVDKRSDIWAFGCVIYEMLTGKLAFPGETISDTLASVLKLEPDWDAVPAETSPALLRLIHRCLEKEARKRLRDIGEARIRIDRTLSGDIPAFAVHVGEASGTDATPDRRARLPWLVAGLALLAAVIPGAALLLAEDEPERPVMRFRVEIGEEDSLDLEQAGPSIALSPDGTRIAYLAGSPSRIHTRLIGQFDGVALSGTENASQPFFSPDGQWIGFFADNKLKKVSIHGGATMTLCSVQQSRGGTWSGDGTIVFAPHVTTGLLRISDAGGEPVELTSTETNETGEGIRSHRWPHLLPGGDAVIFTVQPNGASFDEAQIEVLDLESGARRIVARGGSFGRYVPSGHLVYVHEGTLFALPFDADELEPTGAPVPIVERVLYDVRNGGAQLDFSPQGHLIYVSGNVVSTRRTVVWVEPDGTSTPLLEELRDYGSPRISPDGTRLALDYAGGSPEEDIWIYDMVRGATTRLTFSDKTDLVPVWSPDGLRVAFSSLREASVPNIHWKLADGSGAAERLTASKKAQFATSFSPDGRYLLFMEEGGQTNWDLYTLDLRDGSIELFLQTGFREGNGTFSPDGRWVAYDSDESGRFESYVRPFPAGGGKWQVSTDGGGNPIWSADGSRLYYTNEGKLMVVDVSAEGATFRPEAPRVYAESRDLRSSLFRQYDVAGDGRLVTVSNADDTGDTPSATYLVLDWFRELRENVE
jgi:serine/threonine-protein kinase